MPYIGHWLQRTAHFSYDQVDGLHPKNAKWWLADLTVEFIIQGEQGNIVHYNLTLVRADSAEEAYSKAVRLGQQQEMNYTNTEGKHVTVRFRGLRDLAVIHGEVEDGAELLFEEETDVSEDPIVGAVKPKHKLSAFEPYSPRCP
jgi:hypothetical protein